MSKSPTTPEFKIKICEAYLAGEGSYKSIASKHGITATTVKRWIKNYQIHGSSCFYPSPGNARYSKEFKIQCVEEVLSGQDSIAEITVKYNISSCSVLRRWIKKYNANMELKDYDPKREVYMAEARRKTTRDERKEITIYCIEHNKDYKGTALRFDVSYGQVYSWVRKYEKQGEDGLNDNRGHRKVDEEIDETERLRRKIARLEERLKEIEDENELLKKVKEFERM